MSDQYPYSFGKYRVEAEIGRGGFGTVFRAVDVDLNRPVAVKIMDPIYLRDQRWVARFRREARVMARLDHAHIVPIYEISETEGRLYLAMKFIDGGDLAQMIVQEGALPFDAVVELIAQIASALDYAHEQNVIHRDLKPGNILVSEDQAMLTDFGLASMVEDNSMSVSMTGGIAGTYNYMPPEVLNDEDATPASDVYALGCVLYEMLAGKMLFDGKTTAAIVGAHLKGISLDERMPQGMPDGTRQVLQTALAKEPSDRYPSAGALAEDMRLLLPGNNGAAAAVAGAATVVESASPQQPPAAAVVDSSPPLEQIADPTVLEQPVAPPSEARSGSGMKFALIGLAVILLLGTLGAGYYFVFGGGSGEPESTAASSAAELETMPVVAAADSPTPSPTPSPIPTDLPTDTPVPAAAEAETNPPMSDSDGDGLIGAVDDCPDQPGTVETRGCPATPTPEATPTTAEAATTVPEEQEEFDFDLPAEISILLSEAMVTFHDDFTELSPAIWREAADYQAVDGLLELTDTQACLGRLQGLAANSAILVHFSYDDVPDSDFEMLINNDVFGTANYRQWGTRMNGETPMIQVMRRRSLIDDTPFEGNLTLDPGAWYQLLLAVDQEANFVALLWSSDDPDTTSEYRQTLEDWTEQEWFGTLCNTRGDVFVESYTEIGFDELLLPLVAEDGPEAGSTDETGESQPSTSANQTGVAAQGGGLPMGFESFGIWRRGSQDNGSFTQSSEQANSGGSSGMISYDFPSQDNDFVVFLQLNEIPGSPDTLAAWVYGDGVGHYLNIWIVDSDGQTWQVPMGNVIHSGWKQMSGSIDTSQDWPWTHISGPDNGQVDYPITFRAIVLDDVSASYIGTGEIFIDDISATFLGTGSTGPSDPENTPEPTAEATATPEPEATPEA